jgi:hypothetical protein
VLITSQQKLEGLQKMASATQARTDVAFDKAVAVSNELAKARGRRQEDWEKFRLSKNPLGLIIPWTNECQL